jgi:spermidine/putrescine-binding protein
VLNYLGVGEMRTWRDLSDPKLMGWVALADPTRSSSAKQTFMVIVERAMADAAEQGRSEDEGWAEGMGLIRLIAANVRIFTESSSIVPIMVSTGDAGAGMAIDFYGRSQAGAVGDARMGYVEPVGATIMNPDPIAVVKGAAHRETAIRFIQFVLSEKGQRLWNTRPGAPGGPKQTAIRRLPIRESVFAEMRDFTDQVNPYKAAGGFNKSNAREKTWGVLGELIEASCISLLEELRETRKAILASPRAKELDAKLGRFPFDQKEALRRFEEWKKAPAGRRLEVKRRWEAEFREEYRRLKEAAERGTTDAHR